MNLKRRARYSTIAAFGGSVATLLLGASLFPAAFDHRTDLGPYSYTGHYVVSMRFSNVLNGHVNDQITSCVRGSSEMRPLRLNDRKDQVLADIGYDSHFFCKTRIDLLEDACVWLVAGIALPITIMLLYMAAKLWWSRGAQS